MAGFGGDGMLQRKASIVSAFALPARPEELAKLEAREGVGFGVEDDLVKRKHTAIGEQQVEVLQSLRLV